MDCDGSGDENYDHTITNPAAEMCRDLLDKHQRNGHDIEEFRMTECPIWALTSYIETNPKVEVTPCPECTRFQTEDLPTMTMLGWDDED